MTLGPVSYAPSGEIGLGAIDRLKPGERRWWRDFRGVGHVPILDTRGPTQKACMRVPDKRDCKFEPSCQAILYLSRSKAVVRDKGGHRC